MKKILLLTIVIILTFSGCYPASPQSPSEEIVMYSWRLKNKYENNAEKTVGGMLDFDGDKIILSMKKKDGSELQINENFEIDDQNIVIVSEKLGIIKLEYKLKGSELELIFNNSTLYFQSISR